MTPKKIEQVLRRYEKRLAQGHQPRDADSIRKLKDMPEKIRQFMVVGRVEKAMRWLGFMQGVLWTINYYTLDELKEHNRPDQSERIKADAELAKRYKKSREKVKVHCDEYHAHTATKDCLIPDESKGGTQADVEICKDFERSKRK